VVDDFWFRYVADMGIAGPDRGKGSNYLFVHPAYGGDIPDRVLPYQCPTFTNWVVLHALGGVPAIKQTWIFHTAPPFLTYSELGGLPQDPQCGAESCPRSQEVAEGGFCKVRDLLSTYRVSPGLEPMVGHAVASCGTRRGGAAAWTAIAQPTDLIVLNRRLRTARLGAVRPTSCDRRLRHRFAERPIAAARPRI
jgi:hypothetical protein